MKTEDERDLDLGASLRRALDVEDHDRFVNRVLVGIDTAPVAPLFWDLLASWARRGVPAAIMIAALTAFLLALPRQPAANLDDVLMNGAGTDASFLTGPESPGTGESVHTP